MPASILAKRSHTIQKVDFCIKRRFGDKYSVKPLGSSCYGADTEDSDVDLMLMVCKHCSLLVHLTKVRRILTVHAAGNRSIKRHACPVRQDNTRAVVPSANILQEHYDIK